MRPIRTRPWAVLTLTRLVHLCSSWKCRDREHILDYREKEKVMKIVVIGAATDRVNLVLQGENVPQVALVVSARR